jgi:enoyl-CoA hydratase/carnithine racemase
MHNSENTADPTQALPNGLSVSQEGPVTLLRLSRPAKRNALDRDMIAGIEAFFRSPPDGTRAVVLHGEGSNFSAGLDLFHQFQHLIVAPRPVTPVHADPVELLFEPSNPHSKKEASI